jgi:hypothetical protein
MCLQSQGLGYRWLMIERRSSLHSNHHPFIAAQLGHQPVPNQTADDPGTDSDGDNALCHVIFTPTLVLSKN